LPPSSALIASPIRFVPKNTQHRNVVRAIHYPAQKPPAVPKPGQVRASAHTDYGSLTILRLGGEFPGGLQVMGCLIAPDCN
jgi:isopenicillin N synthase-like dioxygenase